MRIDIFPLDRPIVDRVAEAELQAELEAERAARAGAAGGDGGIGLFGTSLCTRLRAAGILPANWNCAYTLIGAGLLILVAFSRVRRR